MKKAMIRFVNKLLGRPMHKDLAVKVNETNTLYVEPERTFSFRHTNALRIADRKHVGGQGRIAARYFRKLEANQRKNGRPSLFPVK